MVESLRALGVEAIAFDGDGAELMEAWQDHDSVFLIDATVSDAKAGAVLRFQAGEVEIPKGFFRYSSHLFGVAEAVETARHLGRLPKRLIIYGIEGAHFDLGAELSPEVKKAVQQTAARIKDELAHA